MLDCFNASKQSPQFDIAFEAKGNKQKIELVNTNRTSLEKKTSSRRIKTL